jgi:tRNA(fMet)-specific endonuclease VapC
MGLILDSSLLIVGEKEKFDLIGFLSTRDEPVVLAAITASELLHGCHRASSVQQKDNRMRYVEWALSVFEIVPFGLEEARHHAWIWSQLASQGRLIGAYDLLIAGTAICLSYSLATLNVNEFSRVPGLVVLDEQAILQFKMG